MRYLTPANPRTIDFALHGSISEESILWMCKRVRSEVEASSSDHVVCDVGGVTDPDAGTVEALARMQLTARRLGGRLAFRNACGELRDLLVLSGLSDVLPCAELALEPGRETEEGEPARGVEEERDSADPIA